MRLIGQLIDVPDRDLRALSVIYEIRNRQLFCICSVDLEENTAFPMLSLSELCYPLQHIILQRRLNRDREDFPLLSYLIPLTYGFGNMKQLC